VEGVGRTRQSGQAGRLLALLTVLLGLLAMHGLASTHHAAATVPVQQASAATEDRGAHTGSPPGHTSLHGAHEHEPLASTSLGASAPAAVAAPGEPGCTDSCTGSLALLCVAVLAAAAAAAVSTWQRCSHSAPARAEPRGRAPGAARWWPPDLDPVAELCISRT
jgi:hypothetical protein